MKAMRLGGIGILWASAGLLCIVAALHAAPSANESGSTTTGQPVVSRSNVEDKSRISLAAARDRAELMHDIYAATLDMMHERYFHGDRAVVPARALQDVFAEIKRQTHTDARWISVNLKAMSIDHEPKTDFEKKAAKDLASGKAAVEIVEDGTYRRAGAIPLSGGCIGCHAGFSTDASTSAKFAGLVISVPVNSDADSAP